MVLMRLLHMGAEDLTVHYVPLKRDWLTAEGQFIISYNTLFPGRNKPLKARITR